MSFIKRLLGKDSDKSENYKARDNLGTRFRDENHAHDHWAMNYFASYSPVLIFRFDSTRKAQDAIQKLTYIHKASDTGELISTETLEFGCYKNSQGQGEVILCGPDLDMKMWTEAKEKLAASGGELWKEQEPKNA
jgi:hypothetical protein